MSRVAMAAVLGLLAAHPLQAGGVALLGVGAGQVMVLPMSPDAGTAVATAGQAGASTAPAPAMTPTAVPTPMVINVPACLVLTVDGRTVMVLFLVPAMAPQTGEGQNPTGVEPRNEPGVVDVRTSLNVRTGPGIGNSRIGGLRPGTRLHIVGEKDGWYQIEYQGGKAWVCGSYVRTGAAATRTRASAGTKGGSSSSSSSASGGAIPADVAATGAKIDKLMKRYPGSKLQGKGAFIAEMARKYKVPVDLALGMMGMEATFCSRGLAVQNNNPGNIRDTGGHYGQIVGTRSGFAIYKNIDVGIEAYFKLLSNPSGPYWKHVKSGNYGAIYKIYAPGSDGNDENGYYHTAEEIRMMVRRALGL